MSKQDRIGAICKDGWISSSTGQGTGSGHGGVADWIYKPSKSSSTSSTSSASSYGSSYGSSYSSSYGSSGSYSSSRDSDQIQINWSGIIFFPIKLCLYLSLLSCNNEMCYLNLQFLKNLAPSFLITLSQWILGIIPFQKSTFLIIAQLFVLYQVFRTIRYMLVFQAGLFIFLLIIGGGMVIYSNYGQIKTNAKEYIMQPLEKLINETINVANTTRQTTKGLLNPINQKGVVKTKDNFSLFLKHILNQFSQFTFQFKSLDNFFNKFTFDKSYLIFTLNAIVYYVIFSVVRYAYENMFKSLALLLKIIVIGWLFVGFTYLAFDFTPRNQIILNQNNSNINLNKSMNTNKTIVNQQIKPLNQQKIISSTNPSKQVRVKKLQKIAQNKETIEQKKQDQVKLNDLKITPQLKINYGKTDTIQNTATNHHQAQLEKLQRVK